MITVKTRAHCSYADYSKLTDSLTVKVGLFFN